MGVGKMHLLSSSHKSGRECKEKRESKRFTLIRFLISIIFRVYYFYPVCGGGFALSFHSSICRLYEFTIIKLQDVKTFCRYHFVWMNDRLRILFLIGRNKGSVSEENTGAGIKNLVDNLCRMLKKFYCGAKQSVYFSLIELLVVIMIITILAAILLPALNKARSKARTTGCLNHVRQFAAAVTMYAGDNKDFWPYGYNSTYSFNDVYNSSASNTNGGWMRLGLLYHERYVPQKIFLCPETRTPIYKRFVLNYDWENPTVGWLGGEYVLRGHAQGFEALGGCTTGKITKDYKLGLVACNFVYSKAISQHDFLYPTGYGDGSVKVIPSKSLYMQYPDTSNNNRQYHWWNYFDRARMK